MTFHLCGVRKFTGSIDPIIPKLPSNISLFSAYPASAKPKGVRLGYMGHLTFISDEVVKLFERYPQEIVTAIKGAVDLDTWSEYVAKGLRETKERDRVPLGGARPAGHDGMDQTHGESEEDEDEDGMEGVADGELANEQDREFLNDNCLSQNQFKRYLNKQIADTDDPLSDEEEEDDGAWMGDFDREANFDIHGAFTNTNAVEGDPFCNTQDGDFDGVDSDDEVPLCRFSRKGKD
ncbi:hypothetical protein BC936DRAFT_142783 [Jimgerdemannia flammicorona]|uniref:Uncharacterized protein n=1 Tax=Jimgerdemannia flammicorona TaxID=994334 RepID=A0A432ZZU9_9FUNG|nr:hypothetical protein BC936DRAFT_142783 [Jimgerdemannia flammicorona]